MPLSEDERKQIRQLIEEAGGEANPSGWFEPLYEQARGQSEFVPWANMAANPLLEDWLSAQSALKPEASALVIGCGLGDDAEALARVGYRVTAFDISNRAIAWCRERFPNSPVTYTVGDMFDPNPDWAQKFDLVFECRNFQALPIAVRQTAMTAIADCVAPQGTLLMITNYRETEAIPEGPPWPLSEQELGVFARLGFSEDGRTLFPQDQMNSKIRLEYRRH